MTKSSRHFDTLKLPREFVGKNGVGKKCQLFPTTISFSNCQSSFAQKIKTSNKNKCHLDFTRSWKISSPLAFWIFNCTPYCPILCDTIYGPEDTGNRYSVVFTVDKHTFVFNLLTNISFMYAPTRLAELQILIQLQLNAVFNSKKNNVLTPPTFSHQKQKKKNVPFLPTKTHHNKKLFCFHIQNFCILAAANIAFWASLFKVNTYTCSLSSVISEAFEKLHHLRSELRFSSETV